jgi:thiosulfate/3-mercaptopyruvate sulfurtransferase
MVVYESEFGMRAARVAWMLEYAGANRVFLLEGGFRAWRKSHYPTETRLARPDRKVFRISPDARLLATASEVQSGRSSIILDVRSEGEFKGTEIRECDTRRGRIPRSRWIEWTNFHDGERFKTLSEMRPILRAKGISKDREIVTYCHRGARAASAFYALRSLGYGKVKNYIGSWHEWSARKNLPIAK